MKTYSWLKDSILVTSLSAFMTIILAFPVYSQDTIKKHPKTTVKLKIIKEGNGRKTVLDTTITSTKSLDSQELDEIISNLDENMKGLDEGLKEMDVTVNAMHFPDSAMMDSIRKMTKHIRVMVNNNFKSPHFRWHSQPGLFDYNFDFDTPEPPDAPEPPEPPGPPGQHRHHFEYRSEPFDFDLPEMRRGDGSLMDLLRDIPMDRIKSYNIKEKKDGTRITIEVSRGPVLGSSHSSTRTIIVHPDKGSAPGASHGSEGHKKVIIKSDEGDPDEL
jgi:hypothetical protein